MLEKTPTSLKKHNSFILGGLQCD